MIFSSNLNLINKDKRKYTAVFIYTKNIAYITKFITEWERMKNMRYNKLWVGSWNITTR